MEIPRCLAILLVVLAGSLAHAAPPAAGTPPLPPEDLPTAMSQQKAVHEALEAQDTARLTVLRTWYNTALDAVKKDATSKGDLDRVLATENERGRVDRDLTAAEKETLPPMLKTVRDQFDQARAQQATQKAASETAAVRKYMATLEMLEKRCTQKGDIDAAIAARQERALAAEQLTKVDAPPVAVTSSTPAPGAAFPPIPSIKPVVRASPGAPIEVAAEIKGKTTLASIAPEAIGFNAPDGNGRRGSRGVLLKNEPTTGSKGSTWTFTYTFGVSAEGVQIIHPHRSGQVIVTLKEKGLGMATPAAWGELGWGAGDSSRIKLAKAASDIFPLKIDQPYEVVSVLSDSGGYTIKIDGKFIGSGRVTATSPLRLNEKFVKVLGDDLPDKWSAGYAGLLVGPLDGGGTSACRGVKFQAIAVDLTR